MKILKYRYLNGNKYKIFLEDREIILYEDIIIKYSILLKKEITKEELDLYISENKYYELYYSALKYINIKIRSKKELSKYLLKFSDDLSLINGVISKIKDEGYLDDRIYARSYIHDVITLKNYGPLKIRKELIDLGIDKSIIDDELVRFDNDLIYNKIKKYVDKNLKINKDKSLFVFKEKMLNSLVNNGYSREDILFYLNEVSFDDEDIKNKEYDKLYKKLSSKYSGKELEYKIKQKMYAKGFRV